MGVSYQAGDQSHAEIPTAHSPLRCPLWEDVR
jgi:hypothetical protein